MYKLPELIKVKVLHRPSKLIRSPYVADVLLEDGTEALCHTPGLSCCGLVSPGRYIYVSNSAEKSKTDYTAQISENIDSEGKYYIGIHPMVSQKMASKLLDKISQTAVWKTEVKINDHTRLDFVGTTPEGKKIYVEVKNAMISMSKELRETRRAVFPEGFRKSKADTISPRAVKHAETLAELKKLPETEDAYLVYIVPRNDCDAGLELNKLDPTYFKAVSAAMVAGVKVRVFGLSFNECGAIDYNKELKFYCPEV